MRNSKKEKEKDETHSQHHINHPISIS